MARIAVAEQRAAVPVSPAKVMRRAFWAVAPLMTPIFILLCWEFATRAGYFSAFMLPSPDAVVARLTADVMSGDFLQNAIATLYRTFVGFAIAAIAGVSLGLAMMRNAWARWFFDPLVSIGLPMPKIAFLPVFILWFGLFDASKITIIAVTAVFPIITATIAGLQGVERELIWSARSFGAMDRHIASEIMIPAAMPQIITGLQVALPTALIVDIVAEMMMGGDGLGAAMLEASRQLNSPDVFAGIIEVMAIGWAVVTTMAWVRRRLLVWHQEDAQPPTL
jgi:ABC-type nitrate/sulfonate/bicarbonate transport system permease component